MLWRKRVTLMRRAVSLRLRTNLEVPMPGEFTLSRRRLGLVTVRVP